MDRTKTLVGAALNAAALISPDLAGRAAFGIFCRPAGRSRVRPAEREVHDRARISHLTVAGKRVAVYRWGDGRRPVLLVHGWQSRASRFAPLVARLLAAGMSPVAFDAPGHGDSAGSTTTILEFREIIGRLHEQDGPYEAVVAHSFGVACAFAALAEGLRAGRLVAIAGVTDLRFLIAGFRAQLRLSERVARQVARRMEKVLFPGAEADWERFDVAGRPPGAVPPTLLVHDEDDPVVPFGQAERLRAAHGERVRLLATRGRGHRRVLTEPSVLDNALGFLTAPLAAGTEPLDRSAGAAV
ncbi:alpha-beta hydrolase superfamily lysophospholipase [Streptomyces sp. TLI_235]|nr:alpha/beta hydrolase [Streptomyces sp. TLI_235]PBC78475.1 alpha-beta hydrolase superfamily lysophospholipase [Streptomyces sp. TLI_235]